MGDDYDPNVDAAPTKDFSSTGNPAADEVSNRDGGGDYSHRDARIETGATKAEQARAHHAARDDYEKEEKLGDRHESPWW